jgi:5'(3')-deoxyribonucleotidase
MRVAVDADGVLADRVGAALDRVQNWYGPAIPKEQVRDWEYALPDLPVEIDIGDVIRQTACPAHVAGLDLVEGAPEAMRALAEIHEVVIATHRRSYLYPTTAAWLAEHAIPYHAFAVDLGDRKERVGADVLIDDRAENVRGFAGKGGRGILFRQPWNAGADLDGEDAAVAAGWDAVLALL